MVIKPEYKIIADHLRSISFLICDGITPGNEGRDYVLRRIMRRAMLQLHKLGSKKALMYKFVDILVQEMSSHYPDLKKNKALIEKILLDEELKFHETLDKGLKILNEEINNLGSDKIISGAVAFKLYDTYGFPLDITENILKDQGISVDIAEFTKNMQQQRQRAKANWSGSGDEEDRKIFFDLEEKIGSTNFLGYDQEKCQATIMSIESVNDNKLIILDKTPFYATSGGQKGDDGWIILDQDFNGDIIDLGEIKNYALISETKKLANNMFAHLVRDTKGNLKAGDKVEAVINSANRQSRSQGHSATHLLHKALKIIIDNNISQKGSNIEHDILTFDFNLNRSLTRSEINDVEDLINFYIRQNFPVSTTEMTIDQAIQSGAEASFEDKYDDHVRVLKIGPSLELCGGTHVKYSGNIGLFKIISENAVSSGIRRVTAKVGSYAFEYMRLQESKLKALTSSLKVNYKDGLKNNTKWLKSGYNEIQYFTQEWHSKNNHEQYLEIEKNIFDLGYKIDKSLKDKEKQINNLKTQILKNSLNTIESKNIANINLITHTFNGCDAKELRQITNDYKKSQDQLQIKSKITIFFATNDDKVFVCIAVDNDLTEKFDAGKIIKNIVSDIGGNGGGGQKNFAMGGGTNKNGILAAIKNLKKEISKSNE